MQNFAPHIKDCLTNSEPIDPPAPVIKIVFFEFLRQISVHH